MIDVFSILFEGIGQVLSQSYEIIPGLENLTAIIAYCISVILFLYVFTLPIKFIRLLFDLDELENNTIYKKKRRYFKK